MEKMKVCDLMVSTDRFPKISNRAGYFEALSALEIAQQKYLSKESEQRILLVENEKGKVIGKLSPIDLFRGLETNYIRVDSEETLTRFGFDYIWKSMEKDYNLWENPFKDLCYKAKDIQIKEFIREPAKGQSISADDTLVKCFHLFVMNRHDALFVFEKDEIIGVLTFSDVFEKTSQVMKECSSLET
ncbi:MAG: CBS domain-containing protein [Proteobacteria bacterium]|nr:CBS domain-containing protein [Pseudomonadota bacterium]MBU1581850.1 CBS domain-containing protein [Pseudomonadota bacterium]MBU2452564.1 CBS domain-containing protein [Pseudomonadota bacterium]MBU2634839.1 CBS domain-containing protein [Nanoarchaeota archaeon]